MIDKARAWLAVAGGTAAGLAGVVGLSGANAGAEPILPTPPTPPTVTQTVTVAPAAAPNTALVAPTATAAAAPITAPTLVPATSGTLTDFFKGNGVKLEPQKAQGFRALNITLPMPTGWSHVPDPNVPDAFLVIANRTTGDLYTPNAALVVYKLVGDFDPKEAITHGFIDSQRLPVWQASAASLNDFAGMPSSFIEGTYRSNDMTLNTSRRHVIVTSGPDRYLVSLTVTTPASYQAAPAVADAVDAIVNGFRVGPPTPSALVPAPAPAR